MPSHGLIRAVPDLFDSRAETGAGAAPHYERTALDWLANFDAQRAAIERDPAGRLRRATPICGGGAGGCSSSPPPACSATRTARTGASATTCCVRLDAPWGDYLRAGLSAAYAANPDPRVASCNMIALLSPRTSRFIRSTSISR